MKKPAVFLAGVGTCALAVAGCSPASTSTPEPQSNPGRDSAQSTPGATVSPTVDPDTALTSKDGQGGPSAQSGQDSDSSVVVIVQLEESADGEATLASINEAVAASARRFAGDDPRGGRCSGGLPGRQQQPPVGEHPAASRRSGAGGGTLFPLDVIQDLGQQYF